MKDDKLFKIKLINQQIFLIHSSIKIDQEIYQLDPILLLVKKKLRLIFIFLLILLILIMMLLTRTLNENPMISSILMGLAIILFQFSFVYIGLKLLPKQIKNHLKKIT